MISGAMPVSSLITEGTLYAFLLVLARVGGAFVLVPLPGIQAGTEIARIVGAIAITITLMPLWPHFDAMPASVVTLLVAVLGEAVFGLSIGLAVALLNEMLRMGGQILSQQAGFGFASSIDPMTAADAGLLVVIAQLVGSLLFLALGLHREVIRIFALSLTAQPPGSFHADPHLAEAFFRFASDIFSIGLRLSLPAIALLGLVDLSLALLGRINAQLQLIHLSFPLKMLTAMLLIALLAGMYPRVMSSESGMMLQIANHAATYKNGR